MSRKFSCQTIGGRTVACALLALCTGTASVKAQMAYVVGKEYNMHKSGDWFGAGVGLRAGLSANPLASPYFSLGSDASAYLVILKSRMDVTKAGAEMFLKDSGLGYGAYLKLLNQTIWQTSFNDPEVENSVQVTPAERSQALEAFRLGMKDDFKRASSAWSAFKSARGCPSGYQAAAPYLILSGVIANAGLAPNCALFANRADMESALNTASHPSQVFLGEVMRAYAGAPMDARKATGILADLVKEQLLDYGAQALPPPVCYAPAPTKFYKKFMEVQTTFPIVIIPVTVKAGADGELGWNWQVGANHTVCRVPFKSTTLETAVPFDRPFAAATSFVDAGGYASAEANLIIAGAGVEGKLSLARDELKAQAQTRLFTGSGVSASVVNSFSGPSGKIDAFVRYPELTWVRRCWRVCWWKVCISLPAIVERKSYWPLANFPANVTQATLAAWQQGAL